MNEVTPHTPLAKSSPSINLDEHLRQVAAYARQVGEAYRSIWAQLLGEELAERVAKALVLAALAHDWGKIATGFQRSLRERGYNWEFRHEVLSVAILQACSLPEDLKDFVLAAVLTHHRDLDDSELCENAGWVCVPEPQIEKEAQEKFRRKATEMAEHWPWIKAFCHAQFKDEHISFPERPESLCSPSAELERLKNQVAARSISSALDLVLMRGWLMASDHAASAGLTEFRASLQEPKVDGLRAFQRRLGEHKGDAFLEAPTGSGKTLAAVLWALHNRCAGERLFYLLPYQASIEALAGTLEGYFGKENVGVLHARALDYAFREYFERTGEYESAALQAKEEVELSRLVHKPIKVATPFQLLKWFFGVPRWEIGISEMVGGLFVFDEIHAYDAHVVALIVEMVQVIKRLGGRVLFMSATFPAFLRELLQKALDGSAAKFELSPDDEWSSRFLGQVRHRVRWHDAALEDMVPEILCEAKRGKQVLVIANRVAQAQEVYRQLKEQVGSGVHLLHSRFTRRDRVAREQTVIGALPGKSAEKVRVLVATQVVEVSLDISFDTIFTEVAPVDDLLQRFGRVNRYGEHKEGVDVHVACRFDEEKVCHVYDKERMHATLEKAPQDGASLTIPIMAKWVEDVYERGWTDGEKRRFQSAQQAFAALATALRPLMHREAGRQEFYGLFQQVEVLPQVFFAEYDEYRKSKRYLLANRLLVPIPLVTYHMLNGGGKLTRLSDGTLLANVDYSPELGLLPKAASPDVLIL